MEKDRFKALWLSHSSISDYLNCPRSYYLKNVYKDPQTGHKIKTTGPSLSLGSAVHEVIESLSTIPTDKRFSQSLVLKLDDIWKKYSGRTGGFTSADQEFSFKERAKTMLRQIMDNPGPLKNQAVKIKEELPFYWLSDDDEIILCGKIDWLEYLKDEDKVHIIDFKTGKKNHENSLQLPIYLLLAQNCQKREIAGASYWYLETDSSPTAVTLPDEVEATNNLLKIAKEIKLARKLERFSCPNGTEGCLHCQPYEKILNKEAEFVGVNQYKNDIYLVTNGPIGDEEESYIL